MEALRLGCEAHAIDLNPVAHLIELCTLVYPQKFGQPNSRPVPEYISRLEAHYLGKKNARRATPLFDKDSGKPVSIATHEIGPDVRITGTEYRKNPLASDVRYWACWVLAKAKATLAPYYPHDENKQSPAAYLWARTVQCPNPSCRASIPLLTSKWLCRKPKNSFALRDALGPRSQDMHICNCCGQKF